MQTRFSQNATLKNLLLNSGNLQIAESSGDAYWGTGLHLHDRNSLKKEHWENTSGGAMCEILGQVRRELGEQ